MVDESEPEAQPRFWATTESPSAKFGGMLIDIREINVKVLGDHVSRDPRVVRTLLVTDLVGCRVPMARRSVVASGAMMCVPRMSV